MGHKSELLVMRYSTLQSENVRLREELHELKAELAAARAEVEKLNIDNEYLRVSSAIAPDTETAIKTREILSDLVREIDACVADLKKEL